MQHAQHNILQQAQQQQPSVEFSSTPSIPGIDNEPLSLDPQSLGSGGIPENSLLTPMIQAAAKAGQTAFFPPSPARGSVIGEGTSL
jgi:hypothetical protein